MEKKAFTYEIIEGTARIIKWNDQEKEVVIPDCIEGCPVTVLEDYALSGGSVERAELPPTLKKIGKYAFYNCFSLRSLKFFTSILDVGAGAFTGCHKVNHLDVTKAKAARSCFRDILMEFTEEIAVDYHGERDAKLMFPEFYEEGVENTPARILMTQVHGSGLYYRNCFENGVLNFREYDSRFGLARAQESEEFLLRLAMGRLFYPYNLAEKDKIIYNEYIAGRLEHAGRILVESKELENMRLLADVFLLEEKQRPVLEAWIYQAQRREAAELLSYLMEIRHEKYPARRPIFEL